MSSECTHLLEEVHLLWFEPVVVVGVDVAARGIVRHWRRHDVPVNQSTLATSRLGRQALQLADALRLELEQRLAGR